MTLICKLCLLNTVKLLQLKLLWIVKQVDQEVSVFVEISDDAMGQKAIDELNGAEYDGKVINVNVAKPREERSNGGGRGGYNRGGGSRGGYNSNRRY